MERFDVVGRYAITLDPHWHNGDYYGAPDGGPQTGLAHARQMAHISYLSFDLLNRRFGRLTLAEDLAPAVRYAREGYPAGANLSRLWQNALRIYSKYRDDPAFTAWFDTFAPSGKAPEAGEMVVLKDHADPLRNNMLSLSGRIDLLSLKNDLAAGNFSRRRNQVHDR